MEQVVFAQVSDPHFADNATKLVIEYEKNGHDLFLCKELRGGLDLLRERTDFPLDKNLPVVLTGDLTRTGMNPDEFDVGNQFFQSSWPNPTNDPARQYGLELGNASYVRIPGNHDHWDGDTKNQWGFNAAIKPIQLPNTVFRRSLIDATLTRKKARLIVELFGVDSGSGFPPIGSGRNRRARGRISQNERNQLVRVLYRSWASAREHEKLGIRHVRVFLCHHSFQGNWLHSWFRGALELGSPSKNSLKYLAGKYGVAAILTGHTHDFLADRYLVNQKRWLREFRSATTLQAEARYFKQGFFGHRIVLRDDNTIMWSAYPYQWQGSYFYPLRIEEQAPPPGSWNPFHFKVI